MSSLNLKNVIRGTALFSRFWDKILLVLGFLFLDLGFFEPGRSHRWMVFLILLLLWMALASKIYSIVAKREREIPWTLAGILVLILNIPLHLFAAYHSEIFLLNYLLVGFLSAYHGIPWGLFWGGLIWSAELLPGWFAQGDWNVPRSTSFEGVGLLLFILSIGWAIHWEREGSRKATREMAELDQQGKVLRNPFLTSLISPLQRLSKEERKKHLVGALYDLEARISRIMENLKQRLQVYSVAFYSIDPSSRKLYLRELFSDSEDIGVKGEVPIEGNLIGWVFRHQRPICLSESDRPLERLPHYKRDVGIHSFLAAPILNHGVPEGVLCVDARETRKFSEGDRILLEIEAERIVDALEYSKIRHQFKTDSEQLAALNEVSRILGSTLKMEEICKASLEAARSLIDYDFGLVALRQGETYAVRGAYGIEGIEGKIFSSREEGIVWKILSEHDRPFGVPNLKEIRKQRLVLSKEFPLGGVFSLLLVPLISQKEKIGGLVFMSSKPGAFTDFELHFFELLGHQVSMAMENAKIHQTVEEMAITDGLTGLYNHRHFKQLLEQEFRRVQRYQEPLSLILVDVDFFKKVNDQYGHPAGDALLRQMASLLRQQLRQVDFVARYGGEEFVLLLPKTDRRNCFELAERLRKRVEKEIFHYAGSQPGQGEIITFQVTVSLGCATFPQDASNPSELLERTDRALYAAKQSGRNRACEFHRLDRHTPFSESGLSVKA
ncbi:MAG: diguanylate cyclase [Deltaproteobacteria bacterium]|nr:diguanylate cyclase [Deltaproteobacteria bacterium]